MASVKTCDKCGAVGASAVMVVVQAEDVVVDGQVTSTQFGADLCAGCRRDEALRLFAAALDQQERHIPLQRELIALRDANAALAEEKKSAVIERDALKDGARALKSAEIDDIGRKIAANEARQRELLDLAAK